MYLIDTNIWLERLLEQQQAEAVSQFLSAIPSGQLAMSDFTFHSIALALTRRQKYVALQDFIQDAFIEGDVGLLALPPTDIALVLNTTKEQRLDYDDAYQYVIAAQYSLVLVSFDTDFDHTANGRKTPQEVLGEVQEAANND